MKTKPTLFFCLLMDAIGTASYFIPGIGEWFDILWAPLSAFLFYKSFGGRVGKVGSFISFAEEILPFSDFIPTFSLGYLFSKISTKTRK